MPTEEPTEELEQTREENLKSLNRKITSPTSKAAV